MYLVDTSVWINLLRKADSPKVDLLQRLLARDVPVQICGIIYQEILQGAKSSRNLALLKTYFGAQEFCVEPTLETYESAADLYARMRWQGVTVRSSNDCVIASLAVEQQLILVHEEADFDRIAKVERRLKTL